MTTDRARSRPGGRTAAVRESVHAAVLELLAGQSWAEMTFPLVAEKSGVHPATLYRRWGSVSGLLEDVISARLERLSALPDTGSLRTDLAAWGAGLAADLAGVPGRVFLRAALLAQEPGSNGGYMTGRTNDIQTMLDRATARGEHSPSLQEVFEILIAPIYAYALFNWDDVAPNRVVALVDRLCPS
ncbi:TetR/AcrR family transcriptional regulator [Fodinicola feengrottensis]|uniref:TetR/AcrR family transcriptional regulator n=1 Tax=Fodinicola feengrottensis TaxID=435914 RepID=UPI0013D73A2D|nr:TetR-like C-terminal domain-containing protein [Fodinicola feengrottensis]